MKINEIVKSKEFTSFLLDNFDVKIEDFTCHKCKDVKKCLNAYDMYNVSGRCMVKDKC